MYRSKHLPSYCGTQRDERDLNFSSPNRRRVEPRSTNTENCPLVWRDSPASWQIREPHNPQNDISDDLWKQEYRQRRGIYSREDRPNTSEDYMGKYNRSLANDYRNIQPGNDDKRFGYSGKELPRRQFNARTMSELEDYRKYSVGSIEENRMIQNLSPRKMRILRNVESECIDPTRRKELYMIPDRTARRASVSAISCSPIQQRRQKKEVQQSSSLREDFTSLSERSHDLLKLHSNEAIVNNDLHGCERRRNSTILHSSKYDSENFDEDEIHLSSRRGSHRRFSDVSDIERNSPICPLKPEYKETFDYFNDKDRLESYSIDDERKDRIHSRSTSKPGISVTWDEERGKWVLMGNLEETSRIASEEVLLRGCNDRHSNTYDNVSNNFEGGRSIRGVSSGSVSIATRNASTIDKDYYHRYSESGSPSKRLNNYGEHEWHNQYESDYAEKRTMKAIGKPNVSEIHLKSGVLIRYNSSDNKYHAYFEDKRNQATEIISKNDEEQAEHSRQQSVSQIPHKRDDIKPYVRLQEEVAENYSCEQYNTDSTGDTNTIIEEKLSPSVQTAEVTSSSPVISDARIKNHKKVNSENSADSEKTVDEKVKKSNRNGSNGVKCSTKFNIITQNCSPPEEEYSKANIHIDLPPSPRDSTNSAVHEISEDIKDIDDTSDDEDLSPLKHVPRKQSTSFTYSVSDDSTVEASITYSTYKDKSHTSKDLASDEENSQIIKSESSHMDETCSAEKSQEESYDDPFERQPSTVVALQRIPPIVILPDVESVTQNLSLTKLKDMTSNWLSTARYGDIFPAMSYNKCYYFSFYFTTCFQYIHYINTFLVHTLADCRLP